MLSDRLQLIADMCPDGRIIADIGTDHGYLPIALVKSGKVPKAYAMDINKGPLNKAEANIAEADASNQITTLESNGLEALPCDVEAVVIAGMGGMLISQLLEEQKIKLQQLSHLVLSPHLDEAAMRRKIHAIGWCITQETMVVDKGKFYTVMACKMAKESYSDLGYKYGHYLMTHQDAVWLDYMTAKLSNLKKIKSTLGLNKTPNTTLRLQEIDDEINEIMEVMAYDR